MHDTRQRSNNSSVEPLAAAVLIPLSEISFTNCRSSGPGGQNVNKRNTKVRLNFNVLDSDVLSFEQKNVVLRSPSLSHLVSNGGEIVIASDCHRTQLENKRAAITRLHELLGEALMPEKERVPGGRPPHLNFKPSERRIRESRREEQRLRQKLTSAERED